MNRLSRRNELGTTIVGEINSIRRNDAGCTSTLHHQDLGIDKHVEGVLDRVRQTENLNHCGVYCPARPYHDVLLTPAIVYDVVLP